MTSESDTPKHALPPSSQELSPSDSGFYSGVLMTPSADYAKEIVQTVFELMGGTRAMASWAQDNPGDFYTKLFPKLMPRPVSNTTIQTNSTLESYLKRLDDNSTKDG